MERKIESKEDQKESIIESYWKQVDGFGEKYQVSSIGEVRSIMSRWGIRPNPKVLRLNSNKNGYLKVTLCEGNMIKNKFAHRLVAQSFIPNPNNKPDINHINGIKSDNRVENLEWCTKSENSKHAYRIGLNSKKGEKGPRATLTNKQVKEIRKLYIDGIRQCELIKLFNSTQSIINKIILNKTFIV